MAKNFVIALIGFNGSGKSTIEKQIIRDWKKSRLEYKKKLELQGYSGYSPKVHGYDPQKQFKNYFDSFIDMEDKNWALDVFNNKRNSLIILDDYKGLLAGEDGKEKNTPSPGMRQMLVDRRDHNNDFIYSCHSPSNILNILVEYTTHYYIFYLQATDEKFDDKIPIAGICIKASKYVNAYVKKYGMGEHPNSPDYQGQGFPYFKINALTGNAIAVNMNKPL